MSLELHLHCRGHNICSEVPRRHSCLLAQSLFVLCLKVFSSSGVTYSWFHFTQPKTFLLGAQKFQPRQGRKWKIFLVKGEAAEKKRKRVLLQRDTSMTSTRKEGSHNVDLLQLLRKVRWISLFIRGVRKSLNFADVTRHRPRRCTALLHSTPPH